MTKRYLILLSVLVLTLSIFGSADRVALASDSTTVTDSSVDSASMATVTPPRVYLMDIEGAIGVVTQMRIEDAIEEATDNHAQLLIIRMDTPGGFMSATWSICKAILNSSVPVCIYIAPEGSRAGSAGVYMTYAAHFAAMAPSTNIGAAHPVGSGGEKIDSVMNEKITNDAVAQLKAAAERRGRNVEWAEKAVRESVSITSREALELHVIDFIATDIDDLLDQLNGKQVEIFAQKKTLSLAGAITERLETTFMHRFLNVITDPNIVFILFSIGGLGIVLELYHPGAILPGVVGAISLIMAFFAASVLPINYAGVALIMLAIVLFIAEIKIQSAGLLTVGGVVCLFLGGLMLIDTVDPALQVSKSILISVSVFVGAIAALVIWVVVKAQKSRPFIGESGLIGKIAEVRQNGMVYVDGALWKADGVEGLDRGTKVEIIGLDKLILKVKIKNS
jgi:membrane-bound serine protease (ClpP class)